MAKGQYLRKLLQVAKGSAVLSNDIGGTHLVLLHYIPFPPEDKPDL